MIPAPDGADACSTYTVVRIVPPPLSGRENLVAPPTRGSALLRPWLQPSAPPGPCAIYGGRAALGCGRKAAIGLGRWANELIA